MDLLTLVGQVTKKRGEYFTQAKNLALKVKTLEKLEEVMNSRAKTIVKAFHGKEIRWEEYFRSIVDETITSALASVYLGAGSSSPEKKLERAWPVVTGKMLPPLVDFLNQTEQALQNGSLLVGDTTVEFQELFEESPQDFLEGSLISWPRVLSRVVRYLANPSYSFFSLGDYYVRREQGYKQMRRVPVQDRRTCPDCTRFGRLGWQTIGTLPMPGQDCRCYDQCRCRIEYR